MDDKELQDEIAKLKRLLAEKENALCELKSSRLIQEGFGDASFATDKNVAAEKLNCEEIPRYSRQLILPEIGVTGQLKLKNTSCLVIGAGGLGCPALQYLVSAGVGHVGIIDYDTVDITNLHRQILHTKDSIGITKVLSAKKQLERMNPNVEIIEILNHMSSETAMAIIDKFDIVLDCSDNVATRYLLNDACCLAKKPLVSGSALKLEGQLTVYNYKNGPCYRCLFPVPPPPDTVANCRDAGVLGPVTGVIGSLQALEAIKVALDMDGVLSGRLLIFDGSTTTFRNVRLRGKQSSCNVCSENAIINSLINYEVFCGEKISNKNFCLRILEEHDRVGVKAYKEIIDQQTPNLLIDVRPPIEFEICHLENSLNIPLKHLMDEENLEEIRRRCKLPGHNIPVFVICRRGNDSQLAVQHLKDQFKDIQFKDIIGGLTSWHVDIDRTFPIY